MAELGVNIDHVATVRQAGRRSSPIPSGRPSWPTWAERTALPSISARIAAISRIAIFASSARP